jgi:hypothetical protein
MTMPIQTIAPPTYAAPNKHLASNKMNVTINQNPFFVFEMNQDLNYVLKT